MIIIVHSYYLMEEFMHMLVHISGDLVVELDPSCSMGCDTLKVSNTFLAEQSLMHSNKTALLCIFLKCFPCRMIL